MIVKRFVEVQALKYTRALAQLISESGLLLQRITCKALEPSHGRGSNVGAALVHYVTDVQVCFSPARVRVEGFTV